MDLFKARAAIIRTSAQIQVAYIQFQYTGGVISPGEALAEYAIKKMARMAAVEVKLTASLPESDE